MELQSEFELKEIFNLSLLEFYKNFYLETNIPGFTIFLFPFDWKYEFTYGRYHT